MIESIARLLILFLLFAGCVSDIRYRKVSNYITGTIPLIYLNFANLSQIHFFIIVVWGIGYIIRAHGGADVKAMVPLILTLDTRHVGIMFLGFFLATCAMVAVQRIRKERGAPLFLAIFGSYIFVGIF